MSREGSGNTLVLGVLVLGACVVGALSKLKLSDIIPPFKGPLKPEPLPKPQLGKPWFRETIGPSVVLQPKRVYSAVIDGVPWGASRDDVGNKLVELVTWRALKVWARVSELPQDWPGPPQQDDTHRFWARGIVKAQQTLTIPPGTEVRLSSLYWRDE